MNFRKNELFFIVLLIVIAIVNVSDFVLDYQEGSPSFHLLQEAFLIAASMGGISYLLWEAGQRSRELEQTKTQLTQTTNRLSETDEKLRGIQKQHREVIDKQLTDWLLTPSEKEVSMLLLKGLSFEEIASVRETKEKTVRQQATAIYRKSGLSGRYEFAAWFFEDFL